MRYKHANGDWVEIKGAADVPIRDIVRIAEGGEAFAGVVKHVVPEWHFTNYQNEEVPLHDCEGLSPRQYNWLREKITDAVRDEQLDPEA